MDRLIRLALALALAPESERAGVGCAACAMCVRAGARDAGWPAWGYDGGAPETGTGACGAAPYDGCDPCACALFCACECELGLALVALNAGLVGGVLPGGGGPVPSPWCDNPGGFAMGGRPGATIPTPSVPAAPIGRGAVPVAVALFPCPSP